MERIINDHERIINDHERIINDHAALGLPQLVQAIIYSSVRFS